jgi:predicted RNA-binding protein with PIN domain
VGMTLASRSATAIVGIRVVGRVGRARPHRLRISSVVAAETSTLRPRNAQYCRQVALRTLPTAAHDSTGPRVTTPPLPEVTIDAAADVWYLQGMPYLIDGHNLIGAMPGHRLEDPDDEADLIARLQRFCSASGKAVTVYFDRRSVGRGDPPRMGRLTVRFVTEASSADRAICAHLQRLRGEAHNWSVVSSDGEVATAARRAGARAVPSAAFLRQLDGPSLRAPAPEKPDSPLTDQENATLLREFQARRSARRTKST